MDGSIGFQDGSKPEKLNTLLKKLDDVLVNDPERGEFRVDQEVFTNPDFFELEMRYIFEGNWIFLCHESQVAKPFDFLTTYIGRVPVLITRDKNGDIGAFRNVCSHRGVRVCREKKGNQKNFMCPFHGWVYGADGSLLDVKDEGTGNYPAGFDKSKLGLKPVAKVANYRGFIFASLNPNVQTIEDYLAGAKKFIDIFALQSQSEKMEVLRGATRYVYNGNWKLQAENGLDGYHVTTTHLNYLMTTMRRVSGESDNDTVTIDLAKFETLGGSFSFENGHQLLWSLYPNNKGRPNYELADDFERRHGKEERLWMNERLRNLLLFPNVFFMDQTSTQLRIIRPIAVDKTEVTTYCIAPEGESAEARALRIRQYEDFFNASGMATPDDLTEFDNSQIGFAGGDRHVFNDLSRGGAGWAVGAGEHGKELKVESVKTANSVTEEALYVALQEDWIARMRNAINAELREVSE